MISIVLNFTLTPYIRNVTRSQRQDYRCRPTHSIRKRPPQQSSLHRSHILPQLRLLAPKDKASTWYPVLPVQRRLQLGDNYNIWDEQATEAPAATNKLQHPAQPYTPLMPSSVSTSHCFTSPPLHRDDIVSSELFQQKSINPRLCWFPSACT